MEHAPSLRKLARKRRASAHRRMIRAAHRARGGDIDTLHALRIDVKRLRYAIEFFLPLLDAERTRQTLDTLSEAQESLGFLNDLSQAGPRLLAAAGNSEVLLSAVSRIAAHHMPRYRTVVDRAPCLLRALSHLPAPR